MHLVANIDGIVEALAPLTGDCASDSQCFLQLPDAGRRAIIGPIRWEAVGQLHGDRIRDQSFICNWGIGSAVQHITHHRKSRHVLPQLVFQDFAFLVALGFYQTATNWSNIGFYSRDGFHIGISLTSQTEPVFCCVRNICGKVKALRYFDIVGRHRTIKYSPVALLGNNKTMAHE